MASLLKRVGPCMDSVLCLVYRGTVGELLAAGVITPREMEPVGRGRTRYDAAGDRFNLNRLPKNRAQVVRWKHENLAMSFPGVHEWSAREEAGVPIEVADLVTAALRRIGGQVAHG